MKLVMKCHKTIFSTTYKYIYITLQRTNLHFWSKTKIYINYTLLVQEMTVDIVGNVHYLCMANHKKKQFVSNMLSVCFAYFYTCFAHVFCVFYVLICTWSWPVIVHWFIIVWYIVMTYSWDCYWSLYRIRELFLHGV